MQADANLPQHLVDDRPLRQSERPAHDLRLALPSAALPPVSLQLRPPPELRRPRALAVVVGVTALIAACGQADAATASIGAKREHSATVAIADELLHFDPALCSAVPVEFTATGRGRHAGQSFVVTVRGPDVVIVKFGVRNELGRPPLGHRWLTAVSDIALHGDGRRITGTARAADMRHSDGPGYELRIDIDCA